MRKNKTWEITLTNNSRLVANEPIENAVVYTTDTEAYLNFRVIDSGFEFDGATIAMLNKDDGSILERPMTKEDDTAVYEIESDIIPHFGLWQAQVLFKQGEEIFTSTPITFVIERYMMAEQPPRLEDVINWKDLYENATETINELTRINDELTTTNEAVQQAEIQRASAESSRVSAEAQRKIDHANRNAELAGKADKVIYEYSPTLLSGYVGGSAGKEKIRIYKDSFGFVHISGRVEGSKLFGGSNPIFNVPTELRPLHVQAGAICLSSVGSIVTGVRLFSSTGDCFFTSEPGTWTLINFSYFAGL